ncbi:hypothetical protein ANANG_G00078700 [Anguilla anguilla]|uniref:Uncharacterized protein n=1 Tax=Anguilla anguilla TaxID=7936 RepID=A0A9D3MMN4_ANGAN|nr:hypothetical protein ANANG_G00078700 [Anguilla anguilla]
MNDDGEMLCTHCPANGGCTLQTDIRNREFGSSCRSASSCSFMWHQKSSCRSASSCSFMWHQKSSCRSASSWKCQFMQLHVASKAAATCLRVYICPLKGALVDHSQVE